MTDGGHVPNEGLPEHLLAGSDPLGGPQGVAAVAPGQGVAPDGTVPPGPGLLPPHGVPAQGTPLGTPGYAAPGLQGTGLPGAPADGWTVDPGAQRPTFHFVDQPDGLDEDDDVLLMPGPQGSWGEPLATDPAGDPQSPPGTPVEPSWPPLDPPVLGAPQGRTPHPPLQAHAAPGPQTVPAQAQGPEPVTAAQQPRRPLHAGPPIPDPSLMTGQVPVRSLADRGPSTGSTPAHGIPIVPASALQPEPQAVPVAVPVVPVAQAGPAVQDAQPVRSAQAAQPVQPGQDVQPAQQAVAPEQTGPAVQKAAAQQGVVPQAGVPVEAVVEAQAPAEAVAAPGAVQQPAAPVAFVEPAVLAPETVEAGEAAVPQAVPAGTPEAVGVAVAFVEPVAAGAVAARAGAAPGTEAPAGAAAGTGEPVQGETPATEAAVDAPAAEGQAAAPAGPPRRISAFLAAPTPHGLPQVEAVDPAARTAAATEAEQSAPIAPAAEQAGTGTAEAEAVPVAATPAEGTAEQAARPEQGDLAGQPAQAAVEGTGDAGSVAAEEPAAGPAAEGAAPVEPTEPVGPAAEQPVAEQTAGESTVTQQPAVEQSAVDRPVVEQPVVEPGAGEQAAGEQAAGEAGAVNPEASAETAVGTGEMPSGQPVAAPADAPAGAGPATDAPVTEAPAAEQPAGAEAPAGAPQAQEAAPAEGTEQQSATEPVPAEVPEPSEAPAADGTPSEGAPAVEGPETDAPDVPDVLTDATEPAEAVAAAQAPGTPEGTDAAGPAEAAASEEPAEPTEPTEPAEAEEPAEPRGPAAPAYDEAGRDAVHQVIRERRDIRNGFRPDPIPHEVLIRVLEAAHTAPSVGYSQPWDFVVIRSAKTRRRMHALAERQREAYADSLPKGRAKQFKEIKIEAILETPVNIVVTADRTRGGRHTLGRHTQPQMAPYSAALAVENLWLAARAEGLGVGWVSFFDEEELVRELGLPEHLEVVAYLCVGFVDAFPDEPELQQQGWARKRPLSWVVHEEQYGNRALPGEEPHSLLSETLRGIRPLDAKALGEAWDRQKRMTKPAGSLGMLEIISAQLSGLSRKCPPPIPEPACVAVFAADHGVHAQGVTPWPQEVTAQMVGNFLAGGAVVNAFAKQIGTEVCVVDVGVAAELPDAIQQGRTTGLLPRKVKPGTDDMTQGPAMTREEALKAIEVGIETARDLVAAGNKALVTGDMGIANTTASAALISVFTGLDPAEVTGRGTGIDDETHARKVEVIRAALALHQPDPADPIGVLAAVGGLEHAALAGFLLGAASLRTPVVLDGVIAGSAALAAKAIAPEVLAACIAGHRSAEPGHEAALTKLGLRPLIDLDLRLGEGTGALLALPLVQSAARAMHDVATFDSAGVTEKA
ncbi:nicotinate-nucleotide--dimethylbenzimidazole phosphoribosyltransferase [Kitasatospora sp. NPDC056327]|uniref:nicotinate-nucleotide--dimethylbenzimidazole phosphoribosyltransferase n=1 Tax=Kitasatospora sp. NPDC056327 TaxID=3345785 RepID=UPI0035E16663